MICPSWPLGAVQSPKQRLGTVVLGGIAIHSFEAIMVVLCKSGCPLPLDVHRVPLAISIVSGLNFLEYMFAAREWYPLPFTDLGVIGSCRSWVRPRV